MNVKKILFLPVGFLLTNFAYIACCNCKPIKDHFEEATSLTLKPFGSNNMVVDEGVTVYMDSLYVDGVFNYRCVAVQQNPFSAFVNTANACSCERCGYEGLKYALNSIEITSNNIYNGIPAGMSLNNFFKSYDKYDRGSSYENISIDSIKTLINKNYYSLNNVTLYTKTKPGNTFKHQLTMTSTFANGVTFTSKTKDIDWQ